LSRDDRFSFEHNDRLIEMLVVEVGAMLCMRTFGLCADTADKRRVRSRM
jgi:hypothetical protein